MLSKLRVITSTIRGVLQNYIIPPGIRDAYPRPGVYIIHTRYMRNAKIFLRWNSVWHVEHYLVITDIVLYIPVRYMIKPDLGEYKNKEDKVLVCTDDLCPFIHWRASLHARMTTKHQF